MINRVTDAPDRVIPRLALVSTADKRGIDGLLGDLWTLAPDLEVLSTGGTAERISRFAPQGRLHEVSTYTGHPEMQGGLVKTLDWKIYLGLLAEPGNAAHASDLERVGARAIDVVVVNFYPFERVAAERPDGAHDLEALRAHIDIGGPTMARAAAKNFLRIAVLTDPSQYAPFVAEVRATGGVSLRTRFELARAAFGLIARYDAAIAGALAAVTDPRTGYRVEEGR